MYQFIGFEFVKTVNLELVYNNSKNTKIRINQMKGSLDSFKQEIKLSGDEALTLSNPIKVDFPQPT